MLIRQQVSLFGVEFINDSMAEAVERVAKCSSATDCVTTVYTPNIDHLVLLRNNDLFRKAYGDSDIAYCDGAPVYLFSRLFRKPLKAKVSGSDLVFELLSYLHANKLHRRVFLFGASSESLADALSKLAAEYKNIIADGYSPSFGFETRDKDLSDAIAAIRAFEPDIVLVCLGAPRQEIFVYSQRHRLPNATYLCVGGTIDFISGHQARAPVWMQKYGGEWLFRMLNNPRRLFKRYAVDLLYIPVLLVDEFFGFTRRHQR